MDKTLARGNDAGYLEKAAPTCIFAHNHSETIPSLTLAARTPRPRSELHPGTPQRAGSLRRPHICQGFPWTLWCARGPFSGMGSLDARGKESKDVLGGDCLVGSWWGSFRAGPGTFSRASRHKPLRHVIGCRLLNALTQTILFTSRSRRYLPQTSTLRSASFRRSGHSSLLLLVLRMPRYVQSEQCLSYVVLINDMIASRF